MLTNAFGAARYLVDKCGQVTRFILLDVLRDGRLHFDVLCLGVFSGIEIFHNICFLRVETSKKGSIADVKTHDSTESKWHP